MTLFLISVAVVLLVSAVCSLSEAAIFSVRKTYVRQLTDAGFLSGRLLTGFKENMERPISAILIVNTAANTAGAAVAGAQVPGLFGESPSVLIIFSASFTLGVLFFSEIMPKVIGVVYTRVVSRAVAVPLAGMIAALYPVIWTIQRMSMLLKPSDPIMSAPEEEVEQMAQISAEEGSIMQQEADMVHNVLRLNEIRAHQIMTPRPVVFKVSSATTLREISDEAPNWTFSRIPVYDDNDPDTWIGFVLQQDVLSKLATDHFDVKIQDLCQPMHFVSEKTRCHILLNEFLKRRSHMFGVFDEYGSILGVVTLEDVIESVIGKEIVDEKDQAVDMQEVARLRRQKQLREDKPKQEEGDRAE